MSLRRAHKVEETRPKDKKKIPSEHTEVDSQGTEVVLRPRRLRIAKATKIDLVVPLLGRIGGSNLSFRHWRVPELVKSRE